MQMHSGLKLSTTASYVLVVSLLSIALLPSVLSSASALQPQPINPRWTAYGAPNIYDSTIPTIANNSPNPLSIDVLLDDNVPSDAIPTVNSAPSHGSVIFDTNAQLFFYAPDPSYAGTDFFTYQDCDSSYCSNEATVTITVVAKTNHAPVGQNMSFSVNQGSSYHLKVLGSDADGDPWWITSVSGATYGSVALDATDLTNKTIIYAPTIFNPPYTGPDFFTYTLSDGKDHGHPATVSVTVEAGGNCFTATTSGNWNNPATWGGNIPSSSDCVIIPSGITVNIPIGYAVTVGPSGTAVINSGGILTDNGNINNNGIITNSGAIIINSVGTITNNSGGTITNDVIGTMTNKDVIVNNGIINNSGVMINYYHFDNKGTITNNIGGTITNPGGTIRNFISSGTITNNGIIKTNGIILNSGTITNSGTLINNHVDKLTNNPAGIITNTGTITNTHGGTITNNGSIHRSTGTITGPILGNPPVQ